MRAFNRLFFSKTSMIAHQLLSGEFQVPVVLSRQRRVLRVLRQPCPRKHRCAPAAFTAFTAFTAIDYRAFVFTPAAGKTYSLFQYAPQLSDHPSPPLSLPTRYITGAILCTNGIGNFVASYKFAACTAFVFCSIFMHGAFPSGTV
jgi:hypothetical protein